jgi:hypothetical protein
VGSATGSATWLICDRSRELIRVADGFRFGLETLIDRARRRAVKQRIVSIGFLERMHVLPLEVLDDLNFARAAIVERLHLPQVPS